MHRWIGMKRKNCYKYSRNIKRPLGEHMRFKWNQSNNSLAHNIDGRWTQISCTTSNKTQANNERSCQKKVMKFLDAGLIYHISDSSWVSHVYVVPKKGGTMVIMNEKDELIPTHTVTG